MEGWREPLPPPGGVLRLVNDGDDRRIFFGLNFLFLDFFGLENLASIFLGDLIQIGDFFGY